MMSRLTGYRNLPAVFWTLTAIAIVLWSLVPGYTVGWDLRVYQAAMHSLRAGHDPYADGVAVQRIFHAHLAEHVGQPTPFTYVYSPITLPLVRLAAKIPELLCASIYWIIYALCGLAAVWVGWQSVEDRERGLFRLLAPAAIFFPGLLQNDVLFSGNIAYILYGAVLVAAVAGWRYGQWGWLYAAVLAASCFKAPLLFLLAIPVLSARRQWIPACATAAAGVALFAVQPLIWPETFRNYLLAVELQFSYNHDFSSSPAGLLADAFYNVIPYRIASPLFYLLYAVPCFAVLLVLSRRYLNGYVSLKQWMPVMLVGVTLLNPRIMEYDVAPMTLPMALVAWRFFSRGNTFARAAWSCAAAFAVAGVAAYLQWRLTECLVLVALFCGGAWQLYEQARRPAPLAKLTEVEV